MEIEATAKLKYQEASISERLILIVKFKVPNKLLPVKREQTLATSWWVGAPLGYDSYDEFQDKLLHWVDNKQEVTDIVKNIVKEYITGEAEDIKKIDKRSLFNKRLKSFGEVKVKVKID